MTKKNAAPILVTDPTIVEGVIEMTPADLAAADFTDPEIVAAIEAEIAEDEGEELHALAPQTWADIIDFAEREAVDGEGFEATSTTEADAPMHSDQTWRIVVFAIEGDGGRFYVNVDEITKGRQVNTRLMAEYINADLALAAVVALTTYINRWPASTAV